MVLINPQDAEKLRTRFKRDLITPVDIVLYTQTLNCPTCPDAEAIAREVAALSDAITLTMKNPMIDEDKPANLIPDLVPAWIFKTNHDDPGIRYYGLPAGYEFSVILETLVALSRNQVPLEDTVISRVEKIARPLDLKVFVTPTCPYCPTMALQAIFFALVNANITGSVIEASEFPRFSTQYQVQAVPRTAVNDSLMIDGALPPEALLDQIEQHLAAEAKVDDAKPKSNLIIIP